MTLTAQPSTYSKLLKTDDDLKIRIMQAVEELFFKYGFSKVTMDEIADSLGMSKKTLYRIFSSKEDLLLEVTNHHLEECDFNLKKICSEKGIDPLEKLKRFLNYVTLIYAKMTHSLLYDLQRHAPEIWKRVEDNRSRFMETYFCSLIKEGRQKGRFRKDVDEKLFVLIYTKVLEGILNPEMLSNLPFKPNQVFETTIKVLFEGLLTDKARTEYHAN